MAIMTGTISPGWILSLGLILLLNWGQSLADPNTKDYGDFIDKSLTLTNPLGTDAVTLEWFNKEVLPGEDVGIKNKVAIIGPAGVKILMSGFTMDPETGDLKIARLSLQKEGHYTVKRFSFGRNTVYKYAILNVYVAPSSVSMSGLNNPVVEDKEITIRCIVPSVKPANVTIEWRRTNGIVVPNGQQSSSSNTDGTFRVTGVLRHKFIRRDDGDDLNCIVKHGVDESKVVAANKRISVIYPYKVKAVEGDSRELPVRGRSKTISCVVTGEGEPTASEVIWFEDGTTVRSGPRYSGVNSKMLTIKSLIDSDAGTYSCSINNAAGPGISDGSYTLENVLYAPLVTMRCSDEIVEGTSGAIFCDTDAKPAVDSQSIEWYFKGRLDRHKGASFQLDDTSRYQRGLYTCKVENSIGANNGSCDVTVLYSPKDTPQVNGETSSFVEEELTLTCNTTNMDLGNPIGTEYIWKKDGKTLNNKIKTYTFTPMEVTYSGIYSCALKNRYGNSHFGTTNITIHAPAIIENSGFRTFSPNYNNQRFTVEFDVSGTQERRYSLRNNSKDVDEVYFSQTVETVHGTYSYGQTTAQKVIWKWKLQPDLFDNCSTITFFNGDYSFNVQGSQPGAAVKLDLFRIEVKYPPTWGSASKSQPSALELRKELHCTVCAEPDNVTYSWTYNGVTLGSYGPVHVITSVKSTNYGTYTCRAENSVGRQQFMIDLIEKGSPHKPERLRVISRTSTTLLMEWDVAFDGGFPLQKFEVFVNATSTKMEKTFLITDCVNKTLCQFRITNLTEQTMYSVKVRAKNSWENEDRSYSHFTMASEKTKEKPQFVPLDPEVHETYLKVKWLYQERNERRKKRATLAEDQEVGLVVEYKKEGDKEYKRSPNDGSKFPAKKEFAKIDGSFVPAVEYHIVYRLYEGEHLAFALDPTKIKGERVIGSTNAGMVAGGVVAGVIVILIVVVVIVLWIRRSKRRRPPMMEKNTGSGYHPVPHSVSSESLPHPPMLIPASAGHHHHPPVPTRGVHNKHNGRNPENPYENVAPPYANVKNNNAVMNSSQTSIYDNTQYENVDFSKGEKPGTDAHGQRKPVAPIPTKRRSKNGSPPPLEDDQPSGLLYADLMFDEHGQPKPQRPQHQPPPPPTIHGADQRVDYAALDFDQMKANTSGNNSPVNALEMESPYSNVKQ